MFFPNDVTTEIVAHFIGYLQLSVEDLRVRLDYQEFSYVPDGEEVVEAAPVDLAMPAQSFALTDYTPNVAYAPPDWLMHGHARMASLSAEPEADFGLSSGARHQAADRHHTDHGKAHEPAPAVADEPLSTLALINQTIVLDDDDVFVFGDFSGELGFASGAAETIPWLQAQADAIIGSLIGTPDFSQPGGIADFILGTAARIEGVAAGPMPEGTSVVTAPDGGYVNGVAVAETPELVDALPERLALKLGGGAPDVADEETQGASQVIAFDEMTPALTLHTGGNLLVNELSITNGGLNAAILSVQGNYHQLDVIVQVNAFSDSDTIVGAGEGPLQAGPETLAYNIASFGTESRDVLAKAAEVNPGGMPQTWTVSVVSGDLVFVEWTKQFTFQSDQDVHGLTLRGGNTLVTTGENVGLNSISFVDIGKYFDLVIVGGNLYDANIVVQTNILYDNDTIQYLGGHAPAGGSFDTQGNLLWNEASIVNIGPSAYSAEMPDHFSAGAAELAAGGKAMPDGFGSDGAFEGLSLLRVLYVAGDIYDLRYVQQTNVLGDADFVAVQQAALLGEEAGAGWDVSTGANALVNQAKIVDYDGLGEVAYVGGEHYSDAILIQANILAGDAGVHAGDALVSEVIAFLDHDSPDVFDDVGSLSSSTLSHDGPPADIMQSVLA